MTGGWAAMQVPRDRTVDLGFDAQVQALADTRTTSFDANIDDPSATIPEDYSINRAAISGALIAGQDWQGIDQAGLTAIGGFTAGNAGVGPGATDATTTAVNQNSIDEIVTAPAANWRAEVVPDDIFVQCVRCWLQSPNDHDGVKIGVGGAPRVEYAEDPAVPITSVWYRFLMRFGSINTGYASDFHHYWISGGPNDTNPGGAAAWKLNYGMRSRLWVFRGASDLSTTLENLNTYFDPTGDAGLVYPSHSGSLTSPTGFMINPQNNLLQTGRPMYGGGDWFAFISFLEEVDANTFRGRHWIQLVSDDGVLQSSPPTLQQSGGNECKYAAEWRGLTSTQTPHNAGDFEVGDTVNQRQGHGHSSPFMMGAWEIIDATHANGGDPYGLASDMAPGDL